MNIPTSPPFDIGKFSTFLSEHKPIASSSSSSSEPTSTPTIHNAQETSSTSTSTSQRYFPTSTSAIDRFGNSDNDNFWERMGNGAQVAVAIGIVCGVIIIVALSIWYCCGCCGLRAKRRKRAEARRPAPVVDNRSVPLRTIHNANGPPGIGVGDAPPPQYEEAVPPQHQTIAGGVTHVREEEEGIISDGKTPLSEIPFEDVVLDHSPSEGSARGFGERHHGLGGDTTGHTNS